MGLVNCRVDETGLFKQALLPNRNINEIGIRGGKKYFQDIERSPLEFNLTFAFSDKDDVSNEDKLRYVARWLNVDYYKPFYLTSSPNRIFYCMPIGETSLNYDSGGFITLTMRCDGAYAYTNVYTTPIYTSSSDTNYQDISFNNIGDTDVFPTLFIDKTSAGNVEIFNSTTNQLLTITDLVDGESITIDCEREMIKTNLPFTYRYNNFNDEYLQLSVGLNRLQIRGNFKLYFRNYFKILA
jgi:phage-related protein